MNEPLVEQVAFLVERKYQFLVHLCGCVYSPLLRICLRFSREAVIADIVVSGDDKVTVTTHAEGDTTAAEFPAELLNVIADQAETFAKQYINDWLLADPEKLKANIKWRVESLMKEKGWKIAKE